MLTSLGCAKTETSIRMILVPSTAFLPAFMGTIPTKASMRSVVTPETEEKTSFRLFGSPKEIV